MGCRNVDQDARDESEKQPQRGLPYGADERVDHEGTKGRRQSRYKKGVQHGGPGIDPAFHKHEVGYDALREFVYNQSTRGESPKKNARLEDNGVNYPVDKRMYGYSLGGGNSKGEGFLMGDMFDELVGEKHEKEPAQRKNPALWFFSTASGKASKSGVEIRRPAAKHIR